MIGQQINDELGIIWMEVALTLQKCYLSGGAVEDHETPS
jgi:hypothetical protein